jgi:hypothetical protein
LQLAVGRSPEIINAPIRTTLKASADLAVEWLSPVAKTKYGEYRGEPFLKLLELNQLKRPLHDFWPVQGPVWDGLARTSKKQVLLIEAKAHIAEMVTSPARASEASLIKIRQALKETRDAVAPRTSNDWTGIFYQYTNRLAHLYFLRTVNGIKAHLIYVYFLNAKDVGGPSSIQEWLGAIHLMESYMGLRRHKLSRFVHHVFIDVGELKPT